MSQNTQQQDVEASSTPTPADPSSEQMAKVREVVSEFDHAMLVTHAKDGDLRSRPMRLVAQQHGGKLILVSDVEADKIDEIQADGRVNVTMQKGKLFVSVTGTARIDDDRDRISHYYDSSWRVWFPEGPSDPRIALIDVEAEVIEYWDGSGLEQLKFMAAAARALLNEEKIDEGVLDHDTVQVKGR